MWIQLVQGGSLVTQTRPLVASPHAFVCPPYCGSSPVYEKFCDGANEVLVVVAVFCDNSKFYAELSRFLFVAFNAAKSFRWINTF